MIGADRHAGNLPTEKVTKRDVFHIFHKYGKLAQISLKQAYGFVQFMDADACGRALKGEQNAPIRGRKMRTWIRYLLSGTITKHWQISKYPNLRRAIVGITEMKTAMPGVGLALQTIPVGLATNEELIDIRLQGPEDDRHVKVGVAWTITGLVDHHHLEVAAERVDGAAVQIDIVVVDQDHPMTVTAIVRLLIIGSTMTYNCQGGSRMKYQKSKFLRMRTWTSKEKRNSNVRLTCSHYNRNFVRYIERTFIERRVHCDVLLLSARLDEQAVIHRQAVEGVLAIARLTFQSQQTGRIPIKLFDRSKGRDSATFEGK
jgi:hypothetical protein